MRIAIIGAGIVGVTTAYELATDGHDVQVFEQRGSVAAEASFANAGITGSSLVTPWGLPGLDDRAMQTWWSRTARLRVLHPTPTGAWRWLWQRWRGAQAATQYQQAQRLQQLAELSRERYLALVQMLRLDVEHQDGCLVLMRSPRDAAAAQPGFEQLEDLGIRHERLDAQRCRLQEPGLNPDLPFAGGVYFPRTCVVNGRQLAHALKHEAQRIGVRFRFATGVRALRAGTMPEVTSIRLARDSELSSGFSGAGVLGPDTEPDPPSSESFDAVVVCAGGGTQDLLRPLGVRLPLAQVHGYSVTAPLRSSELHPDIGPRAAVIDQRHHVVISRLGHRVRVSGGLCLGGRPASTDADTVALLYRVLDDWFPGAALWSQAQLWKGIQTMLPRGLALSGSSPVPGIWLNTGHGGAGLSLACVSARLTAEALKRGSLAA